LVLDPDYSIVIRFFTPFFVVTEVLMALVER
jgi:hypothetical protein